MTIQSSGAVKFTDIETEFGTTSPRSLSQYYGLDAGIPSSGQIKFSDFYGKVINATRTINGTTDYNARNDFINASIVGGFKSASTVYSNNLPVKLYVIANGIIGASGVSATAFNTGTFPTGSSIYLTNNNYIVGAGGAGGNNQSGSGSAGGPALTLNIPTYITNNGTIAGGGGGGGAGSNNQFTQCYQTGCCSQQCDTATGTGGGGGGGAGSPGGSGGSGGNNGGSGTLTSGGAGGPGATGSSGRASTTGSSGASGGDLGQNGGSSSGGGGSAGNYIVNSGYATWLVTGTRLGGVA